MIRLAAKTSIAVDQHVLGEMTVSMLRGDDGFQRKDIGKLTRWLADEPKPDIVTLPNCLLSGIIYVTGPKDAVLLITLPPRPLGAPAHPV